MLRVAQSVVQNNFAPLMKGLFSIVLIFFFIAAWGQEPVSDTVAAEYFYPNGIKSSEGFLVNKKPDGYWKTYHESGSLKSEGNRKNFQLDSLWRFYDESGVLTLEITYQNDKKNGPRTTFLSDGTVIENFLNDVKTGVTKTLDLKKRLVKSVPFYNGLEEGLALSYDTLGIIIELTTYKRGYIVDRERINRRDADNNAQGIWKWFYDDGTLKQQGNFKNGRKNGIFKSFDPQGNLSKIEKFIDDVRQESAEEVARLELRRDYFPDGKVKVEATYRKGVPEGIRREFNPEGEVVQSYTFSKGVVVAQGIVSNEGLNQGSWKTFYPDGKIKSEGGYANGNRVGEWIFYYPKGAVEQKGSYNNAGKPNGKWQWFYSSGQLLREENYRDGLRDGTLTEFSPEGNIIAQGDFIDNQEEGFWTIQNGLLREEGTFIEGLMSGSWKHFYPTGATAFEGNFVDDNANGKHTYFYPDGSKREEGTYLMGRRNGSWKKWNDDGTLLIEIEYINGIEKAYDGLNIPDDEIFIGD